jgi:hypothetical protein
LLPADRGERHGCERRFDIEPQSLATLHDLHRDVTIHPRLEHRDLGPEPRRDRFVRQIGSALGERVRLGSVEPEKIHDERIEAREAPPAPESKRHDLPERAGERRPIRRRQGRQRGTDRVRALVRVWGGLGVGGRPFGEGPVGGRVVGGRVVGQRRLGVGGLSVGGLRVGKGGRGFGGGGNHTAGRVPELLEGVEPRLEHAPRVAVGDPGDQTERPRV